MENSTLQVLIKNRVKEVVENANMLFSYKLDYSKINFNFKIKGTTAGTAYFAKMELSFNLILAGENITTFLNDTVPHEVAHLYQTAMYPRSKPHGHEWKLVMLKMGYNPERCHHYDTSTIKANRKPKKMFVYGCPCGKTFQLSSNLHTRIQSKKSSKLCAKCRKPIFFMHEA